MTKTKKNPKNHQDKDMINQELTKHHNWGTNKTQVCPPFLELD